MTELVMTTYAQSRDFITKLLVKFTLILKNLNNVVALGWLYLVEFVVNCLEDHAWGKTLLKC